MQTNTYLEKIAEVAFVDELEKMGAKKSFVEGAKKILSTTKGSFGAFGEMLKTPFSSIVDKSVRPGHSLNKPTVLDRARFVAAESMATAKRNVKQAIPAMAITGGGLAVGGVGTGLAVSGHNKQAGALQMAQRGTRAVGEFFKGQKQSAGEIFKNIKPAFQKTNKGVTASAEDIVNQRTRQASREAIKSNLKKLTPTLVAGGVGAVAGTGAGLALGHRKEAGVAGSAWNAIKGQAGALKDIAKNIPTAINRINMSTAKGIAAATERPAARQAIKAGLKKAAPTLIGAGALGTGVVAGTYK